MEVARAGSLRRSDWTRFSIAASCRGSTATAEPAPSLVWSQQNQLRHTRSHAAVMSSAVMRIVPGQSGLKQLHDALVWCQQICSLLKVSPDIGHLASKASSPSLRFWERRSLSSAGQSAGSTLCVETVLFPVKQRGRCRFLPLEVCMAKLRTDQRCAKSGLTDGLLGSFSKLSGNAQSRLRTGASAALIVEGRAGRGANALQEPNT